YRNRFKGRDPYRIIPEGDKRGDDPGPTATSLFQKSPGLRNIRPQKTFCNEGSCRGIINDDGFCTECKKAYIQESQRRTEEQPEIHIVDEDA
ncbi:MAG TPA: hypothetical protein VFG29_02495, partial [Syntrophales bacterium]|nr:hypothetical protein [Syntrophales bacterium]